MPYFFSFFDIGRQAALTCYIPTSDTSCFRCGSGIKKTVSLYFGFFFFFLSFLHWAEHEAVTMQPLQISAPGTVPMHFSVSLLLSRLLLLHPPPPPSPPPSASCKPVSIWLKGGLTHSFTAMQPHHQSSSQWQASTPHSQQPFNPFYQTHPSSVTTLSMVCCLGGSRIHLFMHVFPEEIMSMKEFMHFTAAAVQTV